MNKKVRSTPTQSPGSDESVRGKLLRFIAGDAGRPARTPTDSRLLQFITRRQSQALEGDRLWVAYKQHVWEQQQRQLAEKKTRKADDNPKRPGDGSQWPRNPCVK